jgi:hypothetical protein
MQLRDPLQSADFANLINHTSWNVTRNVTILTLLRPFYQNGKPNKLKITFIN